MKKPAAIQISIPEPCTQAWDAMQPAQGGRHCSHCQKVVVDFTRMTDAQLLDYFKKSTIPCGRFTSEQVDRIIKTSKVPKSTFWARLAASVLFVFGLSKTATAQNNRNEIKMEQIPIVPSHRIKALNEIGPKGYPLDKPQSIVISGVLRDLDGNLIADAEVIILGEFGDNMLNKGMTDSNGRYSIPVTLANGLYFVTFRNQWSKENYKQVYVSGSRVQLDGYLPIRRCREEVQGAPMRTVIEDLPQSPGKKTFRSGNNLPENW